MPRARKSHRRIVVASGIVEQRLWVPLPVFREPVVLYCMAKLPCGGIPAASGRVLHRLKSGGSVRLDQWFYLQHEHSQPVPVL